MPAHNPSYSLVKQDYLNSLMDLKDASKPLITHLTIIAHENSKSAQPIVDAIKERLESCPASVKLPMIYLVDSILKNVGHPYISLFSHVITTLFRSAYTSVTESSAKKSMERVLQTWKVPPPVMGADGKPFQHKGSFFPLTSIEEMERLVKGSHSTQTSVGVVNGVSNTRTVSPLLANSSLSQMPLSTNPHSTSIMNQSSIPLTAYSATYPTHTYQPSTTLLSSLSFSSQPQLSESQLLLADIQNLIFQKQQHQLLNAGDTNNLSQIGALTQLLNLVSSGSLQAQQLSQIRQQLSFLMPSSVSAPSSTPSISTPQQMTSTIGTTSTSAANAAPTNLKSTDTSSRSSRITSQLHSKAIGTGRVEKARDLGKVYLREDDISRRIPHAITLIYNPLSTKCKQCGIRFPRVPPSSSASSLSQSEKISSHMDFHFRLNRKQKESVKRLASRIWYPSLKEWIGGDVTGGGSKLNGKEEGGPVFFNMDGENQGLFDEQGDGGSNSASREKSKLKGKEEKDQKRYDEMRCIAPANNAKLKCVVCNEGFEVVWDEDEEEWMMKNAVKGDGNEVDKYGTDGDWWVHASCSDGGDMANLSNISKSRPKSKSPSPIGSSPSRKLKSEMVDTYTQSQKQLPTPIIKHEVPPNPVRQFEEQQRYLGLGKRSSSEETVPMGKKVRVP